MLSNLERTLQLWGIPVHWPGTIVSGRPGPFTPTHVMLHHTAGPKGTPAPSRNIVRNGRPGLSGPLCNVLVRRDLSVEIISLGKANHAGEGQWGTIFPDQGNRYCIGVEIEHEGTKAEPWMPPYVAFCDLVAAALCDHIGAGAGKVLAHKEYAPTRKIDPFNWNMVARRAAVATLLKSGPAPAREDTDMDVKDLIGLGPGNALLLNQPDRNVSVGELLTTSAAQATLSANRIQSLIDVLKADAVLADVRHKATLAVLTQIRDALPKAVVLPPTP